MRNGNMADHKALKHTWILNIYLTLTSEFGCFDAEACLALRSHFAPLTFQTLETEHMLFVLTLLGRQYKRNRPNFSPILIFKTLANGHVFITSQRKSHGTREGVNTGGECELSGQLDRMEWDGVGHGFSPRAICHTYAGPVTRDGRQTQTRRRSCVSGVP